jgi:hypothetical protein
MLANLAASILWCLVPPLTVGCTLGIAWRLSGKRGGPLKRASTLGWLGPLVTVSMNVSSLLLLAGYVLPLVPRESRTGTYGGACGLIAGWMLASAIVSAQRLGSQLFSSGSGPRDVATGPGAEKRDHS